MDWYFQVLKKYADFKGRARRKEYWMYTLFNLIAILLLSFVDGFIGTFDPSAGIGILASLYLLAVLIPSLAVTVRRLHDTGRSGLFILLNFIPLVGPIVMLIFLLGDSKAESNQYGASPKALPA